MKYTSFLIVLYVILSAILRVSDGSGAIQSSADRIVAADIVGVMIILAAVVSYFTTRRMPASLVHKAFLPYLAIVFVSSAFASFQEPALIEASVIAFGFLISISIFQLMCSMSKSELERLFAAYSLSLAGVAAFFIVDFLFLGLVGRPVGGLTGTFRNTGQAGAFLLVHLFIVLALLFGRHIRPWIGHIAVAALAIALILTLKRAAWAGLIAGIVVFMLRLLTLQVREAGRGLFVVAAAAVALIPAGLFIFRWGLTSVEGMMWKFNYKFSGDTIQSYSEGFLAENLQVTWRALSDHPLFGAGLGNIERVYFHHEIHSTYLAVIATTGLLGLLSYIIFQLAILRTLFEGAKTRIDQARFLIYMAPLYIGLLLSWSYTYHIRKREFWVLLAFLAVFGLMRRTKTQQSWSRPEDIGRQIKSAAKNYVVRKVHENSNRT